MILMAGYIGCDGLQTVLGGILRGTGRQASAVPVIFFSYYLLALPAAFVFAFVFHWGVSALVQLEEAKKACEVVKDGQRKSACPA